MPRKALHPPKEAERLTRNREIRPKLSSPGFRRAVLVRARDLLDDYGAERTPTAIALARRAIWWAGVAQLAREAVERMPSVLTKGNDPRFCRLLADLRLAEVHIDTILDAIRAEAKRHPIEAKEVLFVDRLVAEVEARKALAAAQDELPGVAVGSESESLAGAAENVSGGRYKPRARRRRKPELSFAERLARDVAARKVAPVEDDDEA